MSSSQSQAHPSGPITQDEEEITEWRDALLSVIAHGGAEQARQIMDRLVTLASTVLKLCKPAP